MLLPGRVVYLSRLWSNSASFDLPSKSLRFWGFAPTKWPKLSFYQVKLPKTSGGFHGDHLHLCEGANDLVAMLKRRHLLRLQKWSAQHMLMHLSQRLKGLQVHESSQKVCECVFFFWGAGGIGRSDFLTTWWHLKGKQTNILLKKKNGHQLDGWVSPNYYLLGYWVLNILVG